MAPVVVVSTSNGPEAPDSVPRRIFVELPEIEIELESLVPLERRALPYVWVGGQDREAFGSVLAGFPEVTEVEVLQRFDGRTLFRIEWNVDSPTLECVARTGGSVMAALGTADRWTLTLRFEGHDGAATFQRCCHERDVPLEIDRIGSIPDGPGWGGQVVTERQREALESAYERGYFERPREATQEEIAEELDISAAAAGDRLRRGTANLVEAVLRDDG